MCIDIVDIKKIRQLLKEIVKPNRVYYDCNECSAEKLAKQALDLLPCETCDGSGKIPIPIPHTCIGQTPGMLCNLCNLFKPCPDCQS